MKDIKSLYLTAKLSGKQSDISAYEQCIQESFENDPKRYISNVEYIIKSSLGLPTLKPFIEKYGLPITCYDSIMECLIECSKKSMKNELDGSLYDEMISYMESLKEKYKNCFIMFESYSSNDDVNSDKIESYVETYYGFNQKGIQNRKLLSGMIENFGEYAIPDLFITADSINSNAVNTLLESVIQKYSSPELLQYVTECVKDIPDKEIKCLPFIESHNLEAIVIPMRNRNSKLFRESVLMGDEEAVLEYSEEELNALADLISFKEFQIVCMENTDEILKLQEEIYSLYEEFDGILSESGEVHNYIEQEESVTDNILPILPGVKPLEETQWISNTHNKKTGSAPDYLAKNHDLGYGEDDDSSNKKKKDELEMDELEDFRRPSAEGDSVNQSIVDTETEDDHNEDVKREEQQAINNYYYYTYNNSMNKNSNSFNKDQSSHDDHSTSTTTRRNVDDHSVKYDNSTRNNSHRVNDDHSTRVTDDHSTNKRNHSDNKHDHDNGNTNSRYYNRYDNDKDDIEESVEYYEEGKIFKKIKDWWWKRKKDLACSIRKLPKVLANEIEEANLAIIHIMEDLIESNPDFKVGMFKKFKIRKFIREMQDKNFIDNYVGFFNIRKSGNNFKGSATVLADLNLKSRTYYVPKTNTYVSTNEEGIDVVEQRVDLEPVVVRLIDDISYHDLNRLNDLVEAAYNKYKEDHKDTQNKTLELIAGRDNKKEFSYIVFTFTSDYAKKIWDYVKSPNDHPVKETFSKDKSFKESSELDVDDMKPESDHPVKDSMMDLDRNLVKKKQAAKKKIQDLQNTGRAIKKPVVRTKQWIGNMIGQWKDTKENNVKEKMADPHARKGLFHAIKTAIKYGSLAKAGLLTNPIFLFLSLTRKCKANSREARIRNEMIGEIKTELEILDKKIEDAGSKHHDKEKYQMMRLKNELQKKLMRVGGEKGWNRLI